MGRHHRVQHRQRRESKEVEQKTELQQLRSQNQKLRRENGRLRRDNEKLRAELDTLDEFYEDTPEPLAVAASVPPKKSECANGCDVDVRRIVTPFRTIVVCPECQWRKTE